MLSDIIGQPFAVTLLKNILETAQLSQTFLFVGPEQVGKATTARAFAKALNCLRRTAGNDSCDQCTSCRSIDSGTHPDVRVVAPAGPSRVLRMAQIWPRDGVKDYPPERALLRDLHFAPVSGMHRIFILEDADALNEDTANSLLKVLEEPPPYAIFILTARSLESMLATIVSRSQAVRFRLAPAGDISRTLLQSGVSEHMTSFLVGYSQGRPGAALALAAAPGAIESRKVVIDLAEQISADGQSLRAFKFADDFRKMCGKLSVQGDDGEDRGQRSGIVRGLDLLALWYGDLLRVNMHTGVDPVNVDRAASLKHLAAGYDNASLEQAVRLILEFRRYIERNANAQLSLEALMLRLGRLRRSSA